MSLLAPLYIAGLLAISLPILFHLIRRTPQGRQEFSSLMFLAPSPPRITRRSRLSNILLLLLRAAALSLLAFAFARPFFNQKADAEVSQAQGRRIAILVDTSASMQRGDLWRQATQQVEQVLTGLAPTDEVALFFYDRQVRPAFTFNQWNELDQPRRLAMLRGRMSETAPTWSGTSLGAALATVADLLAEATGSKDRPADTIARQIVLISDLQQGSRVETLQGYQWPSNVSLDVKRIGVKETTNANMQLVKDAGEAPETGEPKLRVRVANQPDSAREQFTLTWANDKGPIASAEPVKAYVPPGRSQIVRIAWPAPDQQADRIILSGDDFDFDNTLYLVTLRQDEVRIVYLGNDAADDTKGLRFYLERVVSPTPQRQVQLVARGADEALAASDLTGARLVVVAAGLSDERAALVRSYAEQGGEVLWILSDVSATGGLSRLASIGAGDVEESSAGKFSLIARVNMDHPLFAPFGDARFSDFTKIHFWKHRKIKLAEKPAMNVVAWFDNGDPFLLDQSIGQGRLVLATSGWQPADSQLALSTKFVPLIDGLLRRPDGTIVEAQYMIDEPIALPSQSAEPGTRSLLGPDGRSIELASSATAFDGANRPGIYRLTVKAAQIPLAVNLASEESRTTPLAVEDLEQWGVWMGTKPVSDELVARQRQMQTVELENRQKLWRWLIVGVLVILVFETFLAGRLAHRSIEQQVTT